MNFRNVIGDLGEGFTESFIKQTTEDGLVPAWDRLEKITGKVVKFSEMNESFAFRIFLKPKRLPQTVMNQDRRAWAAHEDHFNTEYFPFVYWSGNGDGPRVLQPLDRYGRFLLSVSDYPSNLEKDFEFQISKRLYQMREFVTVDEEFDNRFIESEETGKDLFQTLKHWVLYHADIDDWVATLISLWIMTTFFYETFWAFPYLRLNAERGSGKSQILKIVAMCSAMGQFVENPSAASLFRGVDALHCVLAIDEAEGLSEQDQQELLSHLNSGYEYGAQVWRINTNNAMALDRFETYAPKAFGAINQMSPVLESRCLRIPILRSLDPTKYSKRNPFALRDMFQEINENLLFWSIKEGPEFVRIGLVDAQSEFEPLFKGLPPRVHQLMTPILAMYKFLELDNPREELREISEQDNLNQMIDYQSTQHKGTSVNDADQRILVALYDCAMEHIREIHSRDIIERLQLDSVSEEKYYTPHKIGRCLVKYDIQSRAINGVKEYMPKMDRTERAVILRDIFERYSIDISDYVPSGPKQTELGDMEEGK